MANANSARDLNKKGGLTTRHATLTFTEVSGTQEVDTDHKEDHNGEIDGYVVKLTPSGQWPPTENYLLITHVMIPVCNQNRSSSNFTGNTNSSSLEKHQHLCSEVV